MLGVFAAHAMAIPTFLSNLSFNFNISSFSLWRIYSLITLCLFLLGDCKLFRRIKINSCHYTSEINFRPSLYMMIHSHIQISILKLLILIFSLKTDLESFSSNFPLLNIFFILFKHFKRQRVPLTSTLFYYALCLIISWYTTSYRL